MAERIVQINLGPLDTFMDTWERFFAIEKENYWQMDIPGGRREEEVQREAKLREATYFTFSPDGSTLYKRV